jgi:hypothetical protein
MNRKHRPIRVIKQAELPEHTAKHSGDYCDPRRPERLGVTAVSRLFFPNGVKRFQAQREAEQWHAAGQAVRGALL